MLVSAGAMAQGGADPKASPLDAATASKVDAPATVEAKPKLNDPEIARLMGELTGSFVAEAAGDWPALRLNSAAMDIAGLDHAVYFEVGRADAPATPFRQGVFHGYRHKNELRLRIFDFAGPSGPQGGGLKDAMTAMWAAPEAMPKLSVESLDPNLDLVMRTAGSGWTGATAHPYPTARDGAIEMTASISITGGELRMKDAGFAADGLQVWGGSSDGPVFKKSAAPAATVKRQEGGLILITIVPPGQDAPKLVENGQVSVQYTGWLSDGTRFDSSRQPGRDPFTLRVPGAVIRGWNEGLKEIAKGERRRLIIPPEMAYGERGTRDGRIPPNSTLVFDVECVYLDNNVPSPPAQAPPVPMSPHGAAPGGGGATPKPAGDSAPK